MTDLPKTFDPAEIEARWYAHWEANGLFRPERPGAAPWTIVNPPPNVTGSLHIGHALDNTLQDILVRHARLKGKDARWVVGTDHAGIATQMVVERRLNERQQKRTDFSRDEFVAKVWEWKEESGGEITRQLRRLGCSMDWANERFTMDEGFSRAVLKVFVQLYREGLIYRDKRLVNWDPGLGTAISDLEVETTDVQGKFWHLRYPLEDGSGFIQVATTRPETMLADMRVAVNAGDERYTGLVGKKVRLPITGRLIEIITDDHADPELGSGAVKITPGHDFNDFEVGRRAGIRAGDMLNMLDARAAVAQTADGLIPAELIGMDRFDARRRVVAMLDEQGFLERVEDRVIATPFGDRSGVVIEPWLTDQWYVDAATLAKPAIEAVRSGATRIVPKSWEKTYFNWMENIQPWCVSRQLWWGHRIPVWYGPELVDGHPQAGFVVTERGLGTTTVRMTLDKPFVAESEDQAFAIAAAYYGISVEELKENSRAENFGKAQVDTPRLVQESDVLDTWFSSALWPFATLGWPEASSPLVGEDQGGGRGASAPQMTLLTSTDEQSHSAADAAGPHPNPSPQGGGAKHLHGRYPNDILISGFDILFFWDARMMMQGIHFMGEVPFRTLYLHGLVRAADGQKMSKSKGNTVDPLDLIDRYGADALRFFMAAMESQGRDIKMDERRVEGYRNFATKLWNAARFCQANCIGGSNALEPPAADLPVNRWIVGETVKTVQALDLALAELRFDEAANAIYQFVWASFCDWYLELIKPVLSPSPSGEGRSREAAEGWGLSEGAASSDRPHPNPSPEGEGLSDVQETRAVAGWVLDQILVMLHPFMPFVTEELWNALAERPYELILAKWPMPDARALDPAAASEVEAVIEFISKIRSLRTEYNVPPSAIVDLFEIGAGLSRSEFLREYRTVFERMARVGQIRHIIGSGELGGATEHDDPSFIDNMTIQMGGVQFSVGSATYALAIEGHIDIAAERARLAKALQSAQTERDGLAARLANPSFVERAKPEAVEKARADHADKASDAEKYRAALARLG